MMVKQSPRRNLTIEDLLTIRAPQLRHPFIWPVARRILLPMVGYRAAVAFVEATHGLRGVDLLDALVAHMRMDIHIHGMPEAVPDAGPCVLACNHPTGGADGIALYQAIRKRRRDVMFFALDGTITAIDGSRDFLIPVETTSGKATLETGIETAKAADLAFAEGKVVVIFPAGRLPMRTEQGLVERPWVMTAVKSAWRHRCPIIPVHIEAHNSRLHHLLRRMHPALRDATVFHEVTNKREKPFHLYFGAALSASDMPDSPSQATALLRDFTMIGLPREDTWSAFASQWTKTALPQEILPWWQRG
jgi:1-acyl-sn-glycerol-3-phosphate acyltransferase